MAAVANVTEKGNVNTLSYVLSRMIAPSFQKTTVMMGLMSVENAPENTNVVRMQLGGALTASAQTEATALAYGSGGELTDTYVDLTMAACAVTSARSEQLNRFGGQAGSLARLADEQGRAIGRYVDNDAIGLFASTSQTVTSASVMTFDDVALGQFTVFNGNCPDLEIPLVLVAGPRAFKDLGLAAAQTGGAAYGTETMLGIFRETGGKPLANGYRGEVYPGVKGYMTTGFGTTGGDDRQGLFHPVWGFCGVFDSNIIIKNAYKISEGFYDEVGSLYFYDVSEYNAAACVQMRSNT